MSSNNIPQPENDDRFLWRKSDKNDDELLRRLLDVFITAHACVSMQRVRGTKSEGRRATARRPEGLLPEDGARRAPINYVDNFM